MTVVLEPQGTDEYAVRDAHSTRLHGFILWAPTHRRWHAFDSDGAFVGPETSRSRAADLVASGE